MAKKKTPLAPPTPEARENILVAMRATTEPMLAKPFAKLLAPPFQIPEVQLVPILEEFVALGKLHLYPPKAAKAKARYWDRSPTEFGRVTILKTLEAKGPQPEATLRKALKGFSEPQITRIFQTAFEARELWRHPPFGKSKKELIGNRPPAPATYLHDVGVQLHKVVSLLREAQVPRDELRRAFVQIAEAAGISFAGTTGTATDSDSASEARPDDVDLPALMRRIEPGTDRGALIGTRDLRRAARLEKSLFDRVVLELARQGRVSLHRHDYPASLSETEREELVTDGRGTYYVGLALRGGGG